MNYHTNTHINISHVDTDKMNAFTACFTDTVLRPLYDFGNSRGLFGYVIALEIIGEWAKEFYGQYNSKLEDWDSFEESDENVYNAVTWDDFATDWVNDRFKKYKLEFDNIIDHKRSLGKTSTPKIVIVKKNDSITAVFSTLPVIYAVIDYDKTNEHFIKTFESDSVAEELCTLFETDEPMDTSIIKQLKALGY